MKVKNNEHSKSCSIFQKTSKKINRALHYKSKSFGYLYKLQVARPICASQTFDWIMVTSAILLVILALEQGCFANVLFTGLDIDNHPCKPENLRVCIFIFTIITLTFHMSESDQYLFLYCQGFFYILWMNFSIAPV